MRSDAREAAFKIIFSEQFGSDCDNRSRSEIYAKFNLSEEERVFANKLITLTTEHKEELKNLLDENVTRFAPERIFVADRAIIFMALAEIRYVDDVPNVVSVSEAVALARKYSTEKSADFVNGVLAGVINS